MKRLFLVLSIFIICSTVYAQQKHALVIGNGAYTNITKLNNPVNDANDMAAALTGLGFTVDKVLNGSLEQMESAVLRLKTRLSASRNAYGFLFYAGHGVQFNGENYLIPVNANIQTENSLRRQAYAVQEMLDELNDASNELNIVVLDACRDNPFPWKRSSSRGLQVVGNQPSDSIIVFATSAGSTAADGTGKNGLFTSHLLSNLKKPGLEVNEVFRLTMGDVAKASGNQQRPAIYNQFSGLAYLGGRTAPALTPQPQPPAPSQSAKTFYDRGVQFYNRGDYETAIADFTEAIRIDQNYEEAYNDRGLAYDKKGDYDRAIADYTQAIRIDPNYAIAYNNRGLAYGNKKDHDRAIAEYSQAIRIDPSFAIFYNNRAKQYHYKNDYERAITDHTQAIRIDPNYADAYINRGIAYYNKKDYNRAIDDYEAALKIDPNNTIAKNNLEGARKARGW
jgi:uncharacterized caspase-like protein